MTQRFRTASLLLLIVVVLATASFAAGRTNAAAPNESPLALWTKAQLAQPKSVARIRAERSVRGLPEPDLAAPTRMVPLESLPILPQGRRGIIRRVVLPAGDRRVALTFDLCERTVHVTGYDARLVDALRSANAKATFFAGGKWMRSHKERTMQLIADPRFELGNHSWTHANMAVAPELFRRQQVEWTSAQYELLREELDRRLAARGLPVSKRGPLKLFRLPYGRGGSETTEYLNGMGLTVIQWDVVGEGGRGNAQARAQAIADAVRPGSIVLLHANAVPRDTDEVVRRLLPLLARKGYATATVSELLDAGRPETVEEGYFSFPGDNALYDTLFSGYGTGPRIAPLKRRP
jgi:peptidoglycan-N-acetylglucosamine deacetylase